MSFEFVIEQGVAIPPREFGPHEPRESQYPFAQMKQGQSFAMPIKGDENATKKDGTKLTVAEDAKRKAAQKQSYFSSLGKKLGINVVTRFYPEGEDSSGTPSLRVWHNGPRTAEQIAKDDAKEKKAAAKKATPAHTDQTTPTSDEGQDFEVPDFEE